MTTTAQALERPVGFITAAKKLAAIRGDAGRAGGWIHDHDGVRICHGWDVYGRLMFAAGLLAQDSDHDGLNGKWYVWVIGLNSDELARAEVLFGNSKPQGLAGLRSTRWDADRSTWVSVYDGEPSEMDTEGGRWQTVCEAHGGICSHDTLSLARLHYMGDPAEWCEDCRGIERDPYSVTS